MTGRAPTGPPVAMLGAATTCGYCGAAIRHRHGVPFEASAGGPWRLETDGRFHRPGSGQGTHRVHRCGAPPAASATEQMSMEVESWH